MSANQPSSRTRSKGVPIRERAFMVGNITGINGYGVNRTLLEQRFMQGGYQVHKTEHFLLFTRSEAPKTILVHWFAPEAIDANIGDHFMQELKPLGVLTQPQSFGDVFAAVVFSLSPHNIQHALYRYGTNTLEKFRHLLAHEDCEFSSPSSTIHAFATMYRRVHELLVGESFLDVGCSFGFLPLLISEHFPSLKQVVGVDIQTSPFPIVCAIAEERHLRNVQFIQADVLAENFNALGHFDTVVALHILEHFSEADMYQALVNLLKVRSRRLIIAVPYEDGVPEAIYGHEQLFSRTKLEAVGDWCLQHSGGLGRVTYEDCAGGLLMIERDCSSI